MHTIISIAVLLAIAHTQTLDSCTEYCDFLKSDQLRLFWRPDCVCSLVYQSNNYRNNEPRKFIRHPLTENSAIYYKPSDQYPSQRTSFVDYPFYIVNPTYHKQRFKNKENRKVRKINTNNREGELNRLIKKQKPNESAERTIDIDAKDSPLYLDIDVYKSVTNERSNNIKLNELKKNKLTEDDLIECLDLHILVYSKQNDLDAAADLKDIWDKTKIKKYKSLSESDLMIEIQSKCHPPTKILYESLQEIKKSRPRKSELRSTQEYGTKYPKNDNKGKQATEIIVTGENTPSTTETVLDREQGTKIPNSTEDPIEVVSLFLTTTGSNVTDYTIFAPNFDFSKTISEVNSNTDFTTAKNFALKSYMETTTGIFRKNRKYSKSYIDIQRDLQSQYLNNFLTATLESTTMVNTNFEFQTKNATETQYFQTETNTIVADSTTFKPLLNNQHLEIVEIDLKIPSIITKEFENSTVISNINGTELITNNDFVEEPIMKHDITNDYLDETSFIKFTTTETVTLNNFFVNITKYPLDKLTQATNQNKITKGNEVFKIDDKTNNNEEELSYLNGDNESSVIQLNISNKTFKAEAGNSTNQDSANINSIINVEKLNKPIVNEPTPKTSTVFYDKNNKRDSISYSSSQGGYARLKSSNLAQTIRPVLISVFELSNYSEGIPERIQTQISPSQDSSQVLQSINNYLANKQQIGEEIHLGRQNESSDSEIFHDLKKNISQAKAEISKNLTFLDGSSLLITSQDLTANERYKILDQTIYPKNNISAILYNMYGNRSKTNNKTATKDIMINLELANISINFFNETQNSVQDISLDLPSLNHSDKNQIQIKQKDTSYITSQDLLPESVSFIDSPKNLNFENDTELSRNRDRTPELFINETQKSEYSINHGVGLVHESVALIETNNTITYPKKQTNSSMSNNFSQLSEVFDYSNTIKKSNEVTESYLSQSVTSESLYSSIPNTTQSEEYVGPNVLADISESFDLKSKNIIAQGIMKPTWHSPTTDEPHYLDTLNSSITNGTLKEVLFGSPSQDIVGKLFFLFGEQQVPVRFVQNSDGQIKLGLDGETLCDKIIEKDNNDYVIIKAICKCTRFKNCTSFT